VAVVGAGIVGLSVAFHLASRGLSVAVVERSGVGAGQSGVQPGGVRQQWSTRVNCEMARESILFYTDLERSLGRPVAAPVLDRCGYLFVAESDKLLDLMARDVELQQSCGIPSRLVDAAEAAAIVPGLDGTAIRGGTWCEEDGYFDRPQTVVEAFAEEAQRQGATLRIAEATSLSRDRSWRVSLRGGESIVAEHVVVAAGYDTPGLLQTIGVRLPIDREARYLFFSDELKERLLEPLVVAPERQLAAKQLASGRVIVSDLSARHDPASNENAWRRNVRAGARRLLPVLEYVSFPLLVEGHYDITPDHNAIVGQVEENVWVAAGFSGHGFMMAPATGRVLADAICGDDGHAWLDALAPSRFARDDLRLEARIV